MINIKFDPTLISIIGAFITYLVIYYDTHFENNRLYKKNIYKLKCPNINITYKAPIIIGLLIYFSLKMNKNNNLESDLINSFNSPDFNLNQEIFTDDLFN